MPKYLINHTLLGAFTAEGGPRKVFQPGDEVTEADLKAAGFADLGRLTQNPTPGFSPAISVVRGTENQRFDLPDAQQSAEDRLRELQAEVARLQAENDKQTNELETLRVGELRERAEALGVENFATMNKTDLVAAIAAKQAGQGDQ